MHNASAIMSAQHIGLECKCTVMSMQFNELKKSHVSLKKRLKVTQMLLDEKKDILDKNSKCEKIQDEKEKNARNIRAEAVERTHAEVAILNLYFLFPTFFRRLEIPVGEKKFGHISGHRV